MAAFFLASLNADSCSHNTWSMRGLSAGLGDGLDRLHKVLMQRGDEIPDVLQKHINEAYHGLLTRPLNPNRSPEFSPQDDRDFRIMLVIRELRERRTREQAIADVAEATRAKEGNVESVVRKMERFWSEAVERATKRVN